MMYFCGQYIVAVENIKCNDRSREVRLLEKVLMLRIFAGNRGFSERPLKPAAPDNWFEDVSCIATCQSA